MIQKKWTGSAFRNIGLYNIILEQFSELSKWIFCFMKRFEDKYILNNYNKHLLSRYLRRFVWICTYVCFLNPDHHECQSRGITSVHYSVKYGLRDSVDMEFSKIYGIPLLNSAGIPEKKIRKIPAEFRNTEFRWTLYVVPYSFRTVIMVLLHYSAVYI